MQPGAWAHKTVTCQTPTLQFVPLNFLSAFNFHLKHYKLYIFYSLKKKKNILHIYKIRFSYMCQYIHTYNENWDQNSLAPENRKL